MFLFPFSLVPRLCGLGMRLVLRLYIAGYCSIAGFSFGGLLALSLAALLWKLPYLSADLLTEDFICITFGQPIINLPVVQEVTEECPEFESIVHTIFAKADLIPKFLDQKCEEQCAQIILTNEIHSEIITKSQKVSLHTVWQVSFAGENVREFCVSVVIRKSFVSAKSTRNPVQDTATSGDVPCVLMFANFQCADSILQAGWSTTDAVPVSDHRSLALKLAQLFTCLSWTTELHSDAVLVGVAN